MSEEWYERAFGSIYPELYAHRNEGEAEQVVTLLSKEVRLDGARLLDVACGAGRHLARLRQEGARAVGVDLSEELLGRARTVAPVVRGDMRRIPFRSGTFDGAVNMFTSFGYFPSEEENVVVLREVGRVLRAGGWFLIDYLHRDALLDRLVEQGERRVGPYLARERRHYDAESRLLTKQIVIVGEGGRVREKWEERLLLFSPQELEEGLISANMTVHERFGSYRGEAFVPSSERLILFCLRSSP